jgi:hypothetical protein
MRSTDRRTGILLVLSLLAVVGCKTGSVGVRIGDLYPPRKTAEAPAPEVAKGPPPWAPAHGRRAKHKYRYYPNASVYQDTGRGIWFYYKDGKWEVGANLPVHIKIGSSGSVTVQMDTDSPFIYHKEVSKRYPPGLSKGKAKSKKSKRKG